MVATRLNHVSILAHDLEESTQFYEEVFGMTRVPSPNFPSTDVEWLRVGDLTLHLFERPEMDPAGNYHFALWVGDFDAVYRIAEERDLFADFGDDEARVYELPDGSVQLYLHDPVGNLLEVNYHNVEEIDRSIVPSILERSDQAPQSGEAAEAKLFSEEFLVHASVSCQSNE